MFLTSLDELVGSVIAHQNQENLTLGIARALQRMIDNVDDYVDTTDKLSTMEYELSDITESMKDNLNSIISRGEKFNSLISKSEKLKSSSQTFSTRARQFKNSKNWDKIYIL